MGITARALGITTLLALALYFTYGQFDLGWITVLPVIFALIICSLPTPDFFRRAESPISLGLCLFFLALASASLLPEVAWLRTMIVDVADQSYLPWMRGLFAVAGILICTLFAISRFAKPRVQIIVFGVVVASMIAAFGLTIPTSPRAQIDVWTVHEEGAEAFVNLKNPYTAEYTNIYPEELRPILTPGGVTYSYLPGTLMWMAPWKALGLDTRYSQLITRFVTSLLLLLIAWRSRGRLDFMTYVPALLFLTFPLNLFFVVRAWNDDISIMFYSLAAWALLSKRPWAFFLACNCLLLLKHHAIFFVPMLIWMAYQTFGQSWWRLLLKSTFAAVLIHAAYLLADWRNYLGSLYGLTFLKFPGVHHVFPDRRDPFSLMNYLHLYVGYKNSWVFLVVMLGLAILIIRQTLKELDVPSFLRGLAAMTFALFIFAPIAFANYYEFALAMTLIAFAATAGRMSSESARPTWEFKTDWWLIGYVVSRSVILFLFSSLIIETRYFHSIADMIFADRWPYFDFGFNFLPFALIPAVAPKALQQLGADQPFLGYHTLFQLTVLVFDILLATFVFKRFRAGKISKAALAVFVFGPLLVAPLYLTSATVVTVSFIYGFSLLLRPWLRRLSRHFSIHPKMWFVSALGLTALALILLFAASQWSDIQIDINPLLSPTGFMIWILVLTPLMLSHHDWPLERWVAKLAGFLFVTCFALTLFLMLKIEAVFDQKAWFLELVWARNALLFGWLIVFTLNFYRERVVARDV